MPLYKKVEFRTQSSVNTDHKKKHNFKHVYVSNYKAELTVNNKRIAAGCVFRLLKGSHQTFVISRSTKSFAIYTVSC